MRDATLVPRDDAVVFCRGDDAKAALEEVDIEALKLEAAAAAAGSTPEPPPDDAPALPAAAADSTTDSEDDEWGVTMVDDSAPKIDYNGAGSYMI